MEKDNIIHAIIEKEWEQFQTTVNMGHRAYCQDRKETFWFTRKAYLGIYNEDVLYSYLSDLKEASRERVNLVTQKYAFMMEYTDKEYFDTIKNQLMKQTEKKQNLIESIMCIYVEWLKELEDYTINKGGRNLFSESDRKNATSTESYMRGELKTYSEKTLFKILEHFLFHAIKGINLASFNLDRLNSDRD